MHHPMKQLPERAISEDEAREILDLGEYCVVATTDEDGHPYCTPLSYVMDGDTLYIHTGTGGNDARIARGEESGVVGRLEVARLHIHGNGHADARVALPILGLLTAGGTAHRVEDVATIRRVLANLCLKYSPEFKREIGGAIQRELSVTAVWAIELDRISGKAGRRVRNGKGAVSHPAEADKADAGQK